MADFWFFKMAVAAIFDFGNFKFLTIGTLKRVELRLLAKFCRFCSNRGWDMAIFHFSWWRPSAILDWFYACWDHGGLCDYAKFGGNRCNNFDSMQILIFCTLSLKIPLHAPKIGVFGGFCPQNGEQYERDPKRHIIGRKHVVRCIDRQNRSTCAGWARAKE